MIIFVIVTYKQNRTKYQKLLNSLSGHKVIQIDNNKNNIGYGAGANSGILKALSQKAEWVIILNQDIKVTKSAIQKFIKSIISSKSSIIGPFAGNLDKIRFSSIYPSNKTGYISGSFMAIHKDVINSVGLFYEPYFMYYEDVDYCCRAKKKGIRLIKINIDGIKHNDNSTLGRNSYLHQYYLARNHLLFVLRNAPIGIKIHEFLRFPKTLMEHLLKKNYGAIYGLKDFIIGKFGLYR